MLRDHPVNPRYPALRGAAIALLAALLFGVSAPLVQLAGAGVGSFTTAALLYAGASAMGLLLRRPAEREARLRKADVPRLLLMALFGAAIAPVAFAWGLQRADGTSASLMLTLEAVFTALLARWFYGETLDRRVLAAMALLAAGGALLVLERGFHADSASTGTSASLAGLAGVLLATAAWGVDNTVSRALAERDPGQVVMCKGALGAAATATAAMLLGEPTLHLQPTLVLLLLGATGYGLSLRFYLLAQRAFGAARTGSVFSFAPFIGAALAALLASRNPSAWTWAAAVSMVLGVVLHLLEQHTHEHQHEPLQHEHAHVHDDGHHTHTHAAGDAPLPGVAHSHPHQHAPLRHAHAHVPDEHHSHRHA